MGLSPCGTFGIETWKKLSIISILDDQQFNILAKTKKSITEWNIWNMKYHVSMQYSKKLV